MNNAEQLVRIGIIGCGRIAKQHFQGIKINQSAKLVAACDLIEDRARTVAKEHNIDWYLDYREMLIRGDIDVVAICTPNGTHKEIAIATARAGKHAIVEKPLAIHSTEVTEMIEAFRKAKKYLFPVLQVRFNPPLQAVKQIITDKKLGKIHNAAAVIRWARPQEYFDMDTWRGTKKMDGGSLLNQGIHYLDILQWFLGPVESVFAKVDTIAHKIETEDFVVALMKFKNGAYATLEFTLCTYPNNIENSISILGSTGTIKIGGTALDKIDFWEVAQVPRPQLPEGISPNVYAGGLYQGSCPNHYRIYEEAIGTILETSTDHIDVYEAMNSIAIAEAVYESARTRKEIFLNKK